MPSGQNITYGPGGRRIAEASDSNYPPCPHCHALQGDPCRTPNDQTTEPHAARRKLIQSPRGFDLAVLMERDREAKVWNLIDVTLMLRHLQSADHKTADGDMVPDPSCAGCIPIMENATRLPNPTYQDVVDALDYAVARDAVLRDSRAGLLD